MACSRDTIPGGIVALLQRRHSCRQRRRHCQEGRALTKRSLYYHFRSKDELIAAYLQQRDQPNFDAFEKWFAEADGDAGAKVRAVFAHLAGVARSPKWRGCGFVRTAAELVAMPGHPALKAANRRKARFEQWLRERLAAENVADAGIVAQQIRLLVGRAFSVVLLDRDPAYIGRGRGAGAGATADASNALRHLRKRRF